MSEAFDFSKESILELNLGSDYFKHKVFDDLDTFIDFYLGLSYSTMNWGPQGTVTILHLDTYVFSSIQGTLESIKEILSKGRINDSYALLRKYYDSTFINIYYNLYLDDHFNSENLIVKKIDKWRDGTETMPSFRKISNYIRKSVSVQQITKLLQKDNTYTNIRRRCNDHMHYNFYHNILINDNQRYNDNRILALDTFSKDLESLFIQHVSYLFYFKEAYMMASDYIDALELGLIPEAGSQYFVAPFIQKIFDNVIKKRRPDIANEIKSKTVMDLN